MKITLFSSGSCGNCGIIRSDTKNIMIDAGLSKKQIDANLEKSHAIYQKILEKKLEQRMLKTHFAHAEATLLRHVLLLQHAHLNIVSLLFLLMFLPPP